NSFGRLPKQGTDENIYAERYFSKIDFFAANGQNSHYHSCKWETKKRGVVPGEFFFISIQPFSECERQYCFSAGNKLQWSGEKDKFVKFFPFLNNDEQTNPVFFPFDYFI